LFVLSDKLVLRIDVDEADIGKIQINQRVKFYLDTFPDEIHWGKVKRISKEGKLVSNVMQYEVIVFPDKVSKKWISGMSVNAEFYVTEKENVMLLPFDAVKKFRDKNFVVVLKNREKIPRSVKIGITDYKNIEIIKGISTNDKVLILSQAEFNSLFKRKLNPRRFRRLMR